MHTSGHTELRGPLPLRTCSLFPLWALDWVQAFKLKSLGMQGHLLHPHPSPSDLVGLSECLSILLILY